MQKLQSSFIPSYFHPWENVGAIHGKIVLPRTTSRDARSIMLLHTFRFFIIRRCETDSRVLVFHTETM